MRSVREIISMMILIVLLTIFPLATVQGLTITFQASILLTLVCIALVFPAAIIGMYFGVTGVDRAQQIVEMFPQFF